MAQKLRCVIVAVDSSEESMNALKWALANLKLQSSSSSAAAEENGCLVILHVQSPPSIGAGIKPGAIPFGGPSDLEVPAFSAAIEAHQNRISQAIIDHALKICSDKNVDVKTEVVVGDPKEKICEAVEKFNADLLVMGNRGFGPIKRMFLGSVSNYCSNRAQCPVMIVKDPQ
ncbi:PREDICTED: universal stress protein PHOS34 [Ipomoea nil]|uniref:universal stress protein PHOS34 n=1 Tax=Ipomoea nil TaxID=35883 RepID=UPI000900B068|nr:PREDICTED: universal stress protein PHOS34 [Ipomoea nil]